ncbi:hypothetical protein [Desulfovibrio inopinatus]|uniref:hypothetical protein n=1 Tax=Desulfovibrio inopinatus TaxID=102109 RepID=UPI00041B2350|nr:hypothetical protein [Desulfovibrio inopinatus]
MRHNVLHMWSVCLIGIACWLVPTWGMAQGPTLTSHTFRDLGFAMRFPEERVEFSTKQTTLAGMGAVVDKVEGESDDTEVIVVVRRYRFAEAPTYDALHRYHEELARETSALGGSAPQVSYQRAPAAEGGLGLEMAVAVNHLGFPAMLVLKTKPVGLDLYVVKVLAQDLMVAERIMNSFHVLDTSGAVIK